MARKPPPIATRFKKGVSGNPKGKPKGSVSIGAAIKAALLERNARGFTAAEVIGAKVMSKATQGHMDAVHFVADRTDGPIVKRVSLEGHTMEGLVASVVSVVRKHVPAELLPAIIADLQALSAAAPTAGEDAGCPIPPGAPRTP